MPPESSRLSEQLLKVAERRLDLHGITEADLRRARSDLYYALFHAVCESLIEPLGSGVDTKAFRDTYTTLYRLPEHKHVENRCKEALKHEFSNEIKAFSRLFIGMKNKRAQADYDPLAQVPRSSVTADLEQVRQVLSGFFKANPTERARFAYFVSVKGRKPD